MSQETHNHRTLTPEEANFGMIPEFNAGYSFVHDGAVSDTFAVAQNAKREGIEQYPDLYRSMLGDLALSLTKRLGTPVAPDVAYRMGELYHTALNTTGQEKLLGLYGYLDEFRELVGSAYQNGLPLEIERTAKVLSQTKLASMTPNSIIEDAQRSGKLNAGGYVPEAGYVKVDPEGLPDHVRKSVYHEYIHAMTGGIAVDDSGLLFRPMSRGIRTGDIARARNTQLKARRVNFDEPIVDQLANIFVGAQKTGVMPDFSTMSVEEFFTAKSPQNHLQGDSYDNHIDVLKGVLSKIPASEGPIQKLLAMQFEYYDPTRPPRERAPARKAFWKMVHKYADVNDIDSKMSASKDYKFTNVKSYVDSPEYIKRMRERRQVRAQAWTRHRQDGSAHENKQFIDTMRTELDRTNEGYVRRQIDTFRQQGLSDKQIKITLSRIWHPDVNEPSEQNVDRLKILNNALSTSQGTLAK